MRYAHTKTEQNYKSQIPLKETTTQESNGRRLVYLFIFILIMGEVVLEDIICFKGCNNISYFFVEFIKLFLYPS